MTIMQRLPDWPERLYAYIESRRSTPFAWGVNDCAMFAAGAVRATTGVNRLPAFDHWQDARGALRVLGKERGFEKAMDARFDRRRSPLEAQRGDVVLMKTTNPPRKWLAVCDGPNCWAPAAEGLVSRPLSDAIIAWEV
jgi:cell wall-associated NlpC family hydrolase